jgi:subtilisin family serine protease
VGFRETSEHLTIKKDGMPCGVHHSWILIASVALAAGADPYVEGEVIVTLKPPAVPGEARAGVSRQAFNLSKRYDALSKARSGEVGLVREPNETTAQLITRLRKDPAVESVEPNYLWRISSTPNDPRFQEQWSLKNTGQIVGGTPGTSGADVSFVPSRPLARVPFKAPVVAVLDTGIDRQHPDLTKNLWRNPEEIPFNGLDDDGNGFIDDAYGYDFAGFSGSVTDAGSHGTHVAGIIAATGNNAYGVAGVYDEVRLMTLKGSSNGTTISLSAEMAGYNYAIMMKNRGVNVVAVNASFNGGTYSNAQRNAIVALGNAGIVLVNSAGNNSRSNDIFETYPANYRLPNMIVVASTTAKDELAATSNHGLLVDLAAPGATILSTIPGSVTSASLKVGETLYGANPLLFPEATANPVSGQVIDCARGKVGEFPLSVSGNIALIERGDINFSAKLQNARAAGAKAVIFYNNVSGAALFSPDAEGNWLPACGIGMADGLEIKAALPLSATLSVNHSNNYGTLSGTSMAAPHVTAAVAIAAAAFPEESVNARVQRVIASVDVKSSLTGKTANSGRLNLQRLLDSDLNSLPNWWEHLYFNQETGTHPNGDSDHDGMTNRNEFLAGTIPTDSQSVFRSLSATWDENGATVSWTSVPEKTYQVYYSESLEEESWLSDLPGSLVTAGKDQATMHYTDLSAPPTKRFYRVKLVTP